MKEHIHENSRVYLRDCMEAMAEFPDKFFDWIISDVPYGLNVENMAFLKETKTTVKQKNGTRLNPHTNKRSYKIGEWDKHPPPQAYFDEAVRVSKNQIIFGAHYANWKGLGKGSIKWDKGVPDGVSFSKYEYAYCSCIDYEIEIPLLWAGMMQAKSLKEPMTQQGNKKLNKKRIHPTEKPEMLYDAIYKRFGISGVKVCDTHLGSGTHRNTALKFNCDFWAYEINERYFTDHCKRFQTFAAQKRLFQFT